MELSHHYQTEAASYYSYVVVSHIVGTECCGVYLYKYTFITNLAQENQIRLLYFFTQVAGMR